MLLATYYFKDRARLDLGMESPNYAAAVAAVAVVSIWVVILYRRPTHWTEVISWAALISALSVLHLTFSRGGAIACLAGVIYCTLLIIYKHRELVYENCARLVLFIGVFALLAFTTGFVSRVAPGYISADRSISNRITLWKGAVCALRDAPSTGWGYGKSGWAYTQFYQSPNEYFRYATPVNGVLTIGVEFGWTVLCLLVGVVVTTLLSFWSKSRDLSAVSLALQGATVVLFAANFFSTLGLSPTIWVLYCVCAFFCIKETWVALVYRQKRLAICAGAISGPLMLTAVFVVSAAGALDDLPRVTVLGDATYRIEMKNSEIRAMGQRAWLLLDPEVEPDGIRAARDWLSHQEKYNIAYLSLRIPPNTWRPRNIDLTVIQGRQCNDAAALFAEQHSKRVWLVDPIGNLPPHYPVNLEAVWLCSPSGAGSYRKWCLLSGAYQEAPVHRGEWRNEKI